MNTREEWPLASGVPQWRQQRPLTQDEQDAMADEYQREQIATAQSEQAFADNVKEFNRG